MHVYILWHSSSSKEILGILAVGWKWLFSFQNISLPLMGSFTIWNARYSSDWSGGAVLKPWRAESPVMNQTIIHHICILMFLLSWLIATDALPLSWGSVPGLGVICDVSNWIQLQKHAVYWKCTTLNNKLVLSQIKSMMTVTDDQSNDRHHELAICNICGKEGPSNNMPSHIEANHITGVSHSCNICGKSSTSRDALRKHKHRCHN